jgi:hypothetical protein
MHSVRACVLWWEFMLDSDVDPGYLIAQIRAHYHQGGPKLAKMRPSQTRVHHQTWWKSYISCRAWMPTSTRYKVYFVRFSYNQLGNIYVNQDPCSLNWDPLHHCNILAYTISYRRPYKLESTGCRVPHTWTSIICWSTLPVHNMLIYIAGVDTCLSLDTTASCTWNIEA